MRTQNHSFFYLIGGDNAGENYLSRVFQACFATSLCFRQIVLKTIWNASAFQSPVPDADNWECDYQPAVPDGKRHCPDLCLRPNKNSGFDKHIFLESKVGAVLTEEQLKKYIDSGVEILIAVTKNRPQVAIANLTKIKTIPLRWQDFCRSLRYAVVSGHRDRFLCQSFADYLEETDMAYPEAITIKHLSEICTLFNKISTPINKEIKPRSGFNDAHNCLALLENVRALLLEQFPKLSDWTGWGPGYWHAAEDGKISYHALGFSFAPKWGGTHPWFSGRFYFHPEGPIEWVVASNDPSKDDNGYKEAIYKINSISSRIKSPKGMDVDVLDAEKMAKKLVESAKKWNIEKLIVS
jgi:hypothetical protein